MEYYLIPITCYNVYSNMMIGNVKLEKILMKKYPELIELERERLNLLHSNNSKYHVQVLIMKEFCKHNNIPFFIVCKKEKNKIIEIISNKNIKLEGIDLYKVMSKLEYEELEFVLNDDYKEKILNFIETEKRFKIFTKKN